VLYPNRAIDRGNGEGGCGYATGGFELWSIVGLGMKEIIPVDCVHGQFICEIYLSLGGFLGE